MTSDDLLRLTALLDKYGMAEFEYEDGDRHIVLSLGRPPVDRPSATATTAPPLRIGAPFAGVFRRQHPLESEAKPFPRLVEQGEIVGYLQVDAVLRPVIAPETGRIGLPRIADGTLAGYGTHIFDLNIIA